MEYQEVLRHLAPCGLDCNRCAGFKGGEIKALSLRLTELLGGYDRLANMQADKIPAFSGYSQFKDVLAVFSQGTCGGCREADCSCPVNCIVKTCHKEKGVDFCFQCQEYPCSKQEHPLLRQRWQQKNDRMKEIGVVQFFEEQNKMPRY